MSNTTCGYRHIDADRRTSTSAYSMNAKCHPLNIKPVNSPAPYVTLTVMIQVTDCVELTNNSFAINADLVVTSCNSLISLDRPLKKVLHFADRPITKRLSATLAKSPALQRRQKMRAGTSRPGSEIQEVTLGRRSGLIATATSHKQNCRPSKTSARSTLPSSACDLNTRAGQIALAFASCAPRFHSVATVVPCAMPCSVPSSSSAST